MNRLAKIVFLFGIAGVITLADMWGGKSAVHNKINSEEAVVKGSVMLARICPTEKKASDPECAPGPYVTEIKAFQGDTLVTTVRNLNDGSFTLALPYGKYSLQAGGETAFPRCTPVDLNAESLTVSDVKISCITVSR